jgi:hypothetical protein
VAEIWLTSLDGTQRLPLYSIGDYGSWGDLTYRFRWGDGACGMYEASWTMPLPAQFEHPLLRRGSLVEITDGPWRLGSPLVLSEPAKGTGLADPWQLTATGIGRDVEGDHSFYAFDGSLVTTAIPSTAVDRAITAGWRIAGRAASVPSTAIGGNATTDELMTLGALLNAAGDSLGQRWGVGQDNTLAFTADPTTPTYQVVPGAAALGTSDDGYATVVWVRFEDSATGLYTTVFAQDSQTEARFGRKEYPVNLIGLGPITSTLALSYATSILAKTKGRLAWTNGLELTSNEILTMGGVPADLSKVAEDVGAGCMVRLHGIWSDLLEFTGNTWLDIIIGEAVYVDGAQTIQLSPLGMTATDLSSVIEEVTGYKDAA